MHYEAIMFRCGAVGIVVATSSISRGKTNCVKAAIGLAMCGNYPKGVHWIPHRQYGNMPFGWVSAIPI